MKRYKPNRKVFWINYTLGKPHPMLIARLLDVIMGRYSMGSGCLIPKGKIDVDYEYKGRMDFQQMLFKATTFLKVCERMGACSKVKFFRWYPNKKRNCFKRIK